MYDFVEFMIAIHNHTELLYGINKMLLVLEADGLFIISTQYGLEITVAKKCEGIRVGWHND